MSETAIARNGEEGQITHTPEGIQYVVVDQSRDIEHEARARAQERLTNELNEGGRVRRVMKAIWMGGAFKEYYEAKYKREEMTSLIGEARDGTPRSRAQMATIDRFMQEGEEYIHEGESREEIAEASALNQALRSLIKENVEGRMSDEALIEGRTRLLNAYQETHGDVMAGRGLARVDNILQVVAAVRGAVEHGESIDSVLSGMKISVGESRSGVRTEARYNRSERIAEKLSKTRLGSLVQPETIVTASTIAASVVGVASRGVLGRLSSVVVPGALTGLWMAKREGKRIKDDRAQHSRERASGGQIEAGSKRREELEVYRYNTVTSAQLASGLEHYCGSEADLESQEAVEAALVALAAVEARVQVSDGRKVDLITYTDAESVEEERLRLDIARAEAKVAIRRRLEDGALRDGMRLRDSDSLETLLGDRIDAFTSEVIDRDIDAKDRAFAAMRRKRMAKAGAKGAAIGLVLGVGAQEAIASFTDRTGLVEQLWGGGHSPSGDIEHQTVLDSLVHGTGGRDEITHHSASTVYSTNRLLTAPGAEYDLSNDHSFVDNGDGTFDLVDPNGRATVEGVDVNPDGTLPQSSIDELASHNINVTDKSAWVSITNVETVDLPVDEYVNNHLSDMIQVERDLWYDGNTPKIFDNNELGLHWGENGGIAQDGGVTMSVATMTEGGSFHGTESADWRTEAGAGNLKLAVSLSRGTQDYVYMFDVNPDTGVVNIPADHPASAVYGVGKDGFRDFHGGYAELVQITGSDSEGVEHIRPLATLVGENNTGSIPDTVETVSEELKPIYEITTDGYDTTEHVDSVMDMPPVVPVEYRRPLEKLARRSIEPPRVVYGYNGEAIRLDRSEFSPRIRNNPDSNLQLGQEVEWFVGELRRREGDDYVRSIEKSIDDSIELRDMPEELKTIVTIPVAAAYEQDNIYNTLSLHAQQGSEQLSKNIILLNVNWLDTASRDPNLMNNIRKTIAEIERARNTFPELRIAIITNEYDDVEVKKTGGVIGYAVSDLLNTALCAIERRTREHPELADRDIAIIRQDADAEGMSRGYLSQVEKSMDRSEADVFNGTIRSGVRLQSRYPGFGIVTNFSQALQVANTQRNQPWTVGINTVVRASTLAAVGCLGKRGLWSGPGSDDVQLGWRIGDARNWDALRGTRNYYDSGASRRSGRGRRVVSQVAGMTIDSSALRLVPQYLLGRHFGAAWDASISGDSAFSAGSGGYKNREEFAEQIMKDNPRDILDDEHIFKFINVNITGELKNANPDSARKVLALFFGSKPASYRIFGEIGTPSVRFELTESGKRFIANRTQRETNGTYGSYGLRKMRQLYGLGDGKRRPVAAQSPLVAPLAS